MIGKCLVKPIQAACEACRIGSKELGHRPLCDECRHVKEGELLSIDTASGCGKVVLTEMDDGEEVAGCYVIGLNRIFNIEE